MTLAVYLAICALVAGAAWYRLECDDRYAAERSRNRIAARARVTDELRGRLRPRGLPRELADARIRQLVADYRRMVVPASFGPQLADNQQTTLSIRKVA